MSAEFTYVFLGVGLVCLGLFAAGELWEKKRNFLAAIAAIFEGILFLMLAAVMNEVDWGGVVPSWVMATFPIIGAGFAFRMTWKRLMGLVV